MAVQLIGVLVSRLFGALPTLLLVSLITFGLMRLIPGDPAVVIAGVSATPADVAQIRTGLGLDQPLLTQLGRWYAGLLHGDLGRSLLLGTDVTGAVLGRLPVTLILSGYALVLTLIIGIGAGVLAALRQNTMVDQAAMLGAMFGISMPSFFIGPLLVLLFAVHLGWLPTGGWISPFADPWGWLRAATLPEGDPNHYALAPRQVSALTGAVFLVRRTLFEQLGGFDEQLGTFLQDVDFCMRASGAGADLVYEPRAMLFHCESVSTLPLLQDSAIARRRTAEHERFTRRWGDAIQRDPFHNPAYDPSSETLRVLR